MDLDFEDADSSDEYKPEDEATDNDSSASGEFFLSLVENATFLNFCF